MDQDFRPAAVTVGELARYAGLLVVQADGQPGPSGAEAAVVTDVTLDSRRVGPDTLYAALPGLTTHGARFADAAAHAGAVAILTDPAGAQLISSMPADAQARRLPLLVAPEPRALVGALAALVHGRPAQRLQVFGITGTNGKTTTAHLLESALRALGRHPGIIGTVGTRIDGETIKTARTTPEAPDLHRLFALMLGRGADCVVMEVSSHALVQHRVDGIVYDVAVFTNLSQDHLDFHPTMEDYFAAKASLFTPRRSRRGVVCVDDDWGRRLAEQAGIPVVTVGSLAPITGTGAGTGAQPAPDWQIVIDPADHGAFSLTGPATAPTTGLTAGAPEDPAAIVTLRLRSHLPGDFNVVNTALAAVALVTAGVDPAEVTRAMQVPPHVPGRMEQVARTGEAGAAGDPESALGGEAGAAGDPRCVVDFAHTPAAVEAALAALRSSTPGRLIVVLGAGGDRDRAKRRAMGASAAVGADLVIVTDDNPRSEDPAAIRAEVMAGTEQAGSGGEPAIEVTTGRADAIGVAVAAARRSSDPTRDTVVVLGKGHETGQEVDGVVHHFDDREAVQAALAGRDYRPDAGNAGPGDGRGAALPHVGEPS